MNVDINIEEVQRGSFKIVHAWDKDQGLVTRIQFDCKTQPMREARILNLLRQGGPMNVTISASQAMLDLQFVDEKRGEVNMVTAAGEWRPREGFLIVRVEGKFNEVASGEPACLAIIWREGEDSDHELSAQFTGQTPTEAAMKAVAGLGLVPSDMMEPVDALRTLAEVYTATPGLRELLVILETGTFQISELMNQEAGANGPQEEKPKKKRAPRKKTATTPGGEPVDEDTGEIG